MAASAFLSKENGGKGNFTGPWKEYKNPNTVNDPKAFSDEIIGYAEVGGEKFHFIGYKDNVTGVTSN